jgi:hypothetical protein
MEMHVSNISPIRPDSEAASKRKAKPRPIPTQAVSVRKSEMMTMLGIGATKADELIKTGKVKSVLLGRTRLISMESIRQLIDGQAA